VRTYLARECVKAAFLLSSPEHMRDALGRERVSERRACRVLWQARCTQRRERQVASDEPRPVRQMVALATDYGR
jgi:hypothetical protein